MMTQTDKERQYYSVCFAEEQTKFVKSIPPYVRDVIRLLKYWKKVLVYPYYLFRLCTVCVVVCACVGVKMCITCHVFLVENF